MTFLKKPAFDSVIFLLVLTLLGTPVSLAQDRSDSPTTTDLNDQIEQISKEFKRSGDAETTLSQYERLYEETIADQKSRIRLREEFARLRPLVKPNTDQNKAGVWKVKAFVIRSTDFKWNANNEEKEFQASFTPSEIERIQRGMQGFADFVWKFSNGWLRIEWTCEVVEKTLTNFDAIGDLYWSGPDVTMELLPDFPDNSTDTIMIFVKTGGDVAPNAQTDPIPLYSFGAAIGEWVPYTRGATYITFHWETNSAIAEPDGEPMMHEWLHSLQWALEERRHYPQGLAGNPDGGRFIGEERDLDEADPCYRRDPEKENSWIGLYEHILQTHTTRKMLKEASLRVSRTKE